jgi:hypothetical protein
MSASERKISEAARGRIADALAQKQPRRGR